MPAKTGKAEKKTVKKGKEKDLIEFLINASRENSTVGGQFLNLLEKPGVTAKDLKDFFTKREYKSPKEDDLAKLLEAFKKNERFKSLLMGTGY